MPLQPGQPLPTDPEKLDGVVKAAIVLLSLDHDVAGELLKHLPPQMVEEVTRALASLQRTIHLAKHGGMKRYVAEALLERAELQLRQGRTALAADSVREARAEGGEIMPDSWLHLALASLAQRSR